MEEISFDHDGITYSMTPKEIEAAYAYRHRLDMLDDAQRQLELYAFGVTRDCLDDNSVVENTRLFQSQHSISFDLVLKHIGDIVNQFELLQREDIEDDMTWAVAIEAVISDLASRHPTCYEQLEEAYRESAPYLFIVALNALIENGRGQIHDSTRTDIFAGYPLSETQKASALRIALLMAATEPDVLMAFVQRAMLPFQDYQGERIPFLRPHGDEETVCPACHRDGIRIKDDIMTLDDGTLMEWKCPSCGATGNARYRLSFFRHVMVDDADGRHIPGREWEIT